MKAQRVQNVVLLAFFLSGASGLMLQTVWVRMLTRLLGATTYAMATVLGVFMAGLAIGSWLGGRWADRARRPLLGYALLELGVCVTGVLCSFATIEGLGTLYVRMVRDWHDQPQLLLAIRVLYASACLLPPTILMGATLPLLAAFITRAGEVFQSGLGWLYAANTLGAVCGVLAAGFVLLGFWGETNTILLSAGLNIAATILALLLWRRQTSAPATPAATVAEEPWTPYAPTRRRLALVAFFVSGFSALAYEVLWARLLVLLLDTSIYAFSLMLTVFLLGIAWGSTWGARQSGRKGLATFAVLEVLIGGLTALSVLLLPSFHHWWLHWGGLTDASLAGVGVGTVACLALLLPVAFCFGWQFPVAVRCCMAQSDAPGKTTGYAYVVNTLGTVAGSLLAGFVLIPWLGSATTLLVLGGGNILMGVLLGVAAGPSEGRRAWSLTAVAAVALLAVTAFQGEPYRRMIGDRLRADLEPGWTMFAVYEGSTATTIPAGIPDRPQKRALLINGCGVTGLVSETKLMTHLPYALTDNPRRFLVICFGMGTTARSASRYPGLHIDAVDIVPEVFDALPFFHRDAATVRKVPTLHLHSDDGRNFLLTHPGDYDVITIDPAPPLYSAGTVNLYTVEFFRLCKAMLRPSGVLCMWIPPAAETDILMIMRSYVEVFPKATLWGAHTYGGFWLIGHGDDRPVETARAVRILDNQIAVDDLGEWDRTYLTESSLRSMPLLDGDGLRKLTAHVPAVTDDRPYTEFPLWRRWYDPGTLRPLNAAVLRQRLGRE